MNARTLALFTGCHFITAPLFAQAQQPSAGELRLREQVKSMTLQLRNAETDKATLQAAKTEAEQKSTKLEEQVKALTKQAAEDKESTDKAAAKLTQEITAKEADLARVNELLVKSDDTGKKSAALLKKTEEQRAKLAAEVIQLQRTVTEQRGKNAKMYEAAEEVLSRYEKFGLGTALTAREPFAGITRARLQTYVDESDAKISAGRIHTDEAPSKAAAAEAKKQPKR